MRLKTPPPPSATESVTEFLRQIGRAVSEAGRALERLADAVPSFVPPPPPPTPDRAPEPPPRPRPRAEYVNTKDAADYMGFKSNTLRMRKSETGSGYISAQVVARRFGIKTGTLSKWRSSGRGPKGWLHLSATRVVYPEAAVDEFLRELTANPPKFRLSRNVRQSPEGEP
jgi:hypothetical protein